MSSNIIMGYSPNNFFYSQAGNMPSDTDCDQKYDDAGSVLKKSDGTTTTWDALCNENNFMDNSGNCINRQLCINKKQVDFLVENENSHLDAEKRNTDMKVVYDRTIMDSVNLGIGIIFILFIIFRNRNIS